tara:strand:+ start:70 stop:270 length:201 start_codon:yes stop_codon:yes gene_type:complete
MRHQRYSLPGLLVVLCFPIASATPPPPVGGADTIEVENKKSSWDECKELLEKTKKKKKKDSPKKED